MRTSPFLEEHDHLRHAVRQWISDHVADAVATWEDEGAVPPAIRTALGRAGLLGLSAPTAVGGQDADTLAELVLAEELGRSGAASLAALVLAHLEAIDLSVLADPKATWLSETVAGTSWLAVLAPDAPAAAAAPVAARASGDQWILDGHQSCVVGAPIADRLVVVAATEPGGQWLLAVVDRDSDGVEVDDRADLLGLGAAPTADVRLRDAATAEARPLESGEDLAARLAAHRVRTAAVQVGLADLAASTAVDYARQRETFGRPIAHHQVITHLLVDLRTAVTAGTALVRDTAVDVAAGGPVARAWSTLAHTADVAATVTDDALQVHGGAGYSEDYDIERLWRDVRTLAVLGTTREAARHVTAHALTGLATPRPRASDPLGDLTDLRTRARQFVSAELAPHVPSWEAQRETPRSIFRTVGSAGWFGALFDPRWGGTGPDLAAQAVWIEELTRAGSGGLAADLGASIDLAALYVARAGTDDQKQRWLVPSITGEVVGALAITEPGTGSDVAGITTRARRADDGWVIDGAKVFITNGPWADHVVVACKVAPEDGGGESPHGQITLFVVEADTPGFSRRRLGMLGWHTSHTGELTFDSVHVSDDHRLGEIGSGFLHIVGNFAWERLTLSLGAVVAAESTLHAAVSRWATADGTAADPVAGLLVDLAGRVAAARSLTDRALRLVVAQDRARRGDGNGPDDREVLQVVSMSKLVTQRLAVDVAEVALRVEGADGARRSGATQRHLRDARLGPIGGGTDQIMRQVIASTMGL